MLVPEAEQDWPSPSPPADASHDTLLDHRSGGHAGSDLTAALCRLVADGLDVVAVRIDHITAVVVGVVDGANAGCAIVDSAGLECRGVERIDLTAAVSGQGGSAEARPVQYPVNRSCEERQLVLVREAVHGDGDGAA
jgi:hypothetical protein